MPMLACKAMAFPMLILACGGVLFATPPTPLSLEQSLQKATSFAPEHHALQQKQGSLDLAKKRVALWQDPELTTEFEELRLSGNQRGFENAEFTTSLTQPLRIPGTTRLLRKRLDQEQSVVNAEQSNLRRNLRAETLRRYYDLLAEQERSDLLERQWTLAKEMVDVVTRKVKAGKVAPMEAKKAELQAVRARMLWDAARRNQENKATVLLAMWGETEPTPLLTTAWPAAVPLPSHETAPTDNHPQLSIQTARRHQTELDLSLLRKQRFGAFGVTVGRRHNGELGETSYLSGLSVTLPLWRRNKTAAAQTKAVIADQEAVLARTKLDLQQAWRTSLVQLAQIDHQLRATQDELLPTARQLYNTVATGYRHGKFGYLDVLEAQRERILVEGELIEQQRTRVNQLIQLERLSGLTLIQSPSEPGGTP